MIALHAFSDGIIALAYFSILFLFVYVMRRRGDISLTPLFLTGGLFIVTCGMTHLFNIYEIQYGPSWLTGSVKLVAATACVATANMIIPLLPRILTLKSATALEHINNRLSQALDEKENLLALYRRERHVAATLQEAWLPSSLPSIAGIKFDAVHRAAGSEADIGGDWYDAFLLDNGKLLITVGDVAGHGLPAAITMGNLRRALRVLALEKDDPAALLSAVDTMLRMENEATMVTAFVALYDAQTHTLTYANAGHPPPLLRNPDGSILTLSLGQAPLGIGIDDTIVVHRMEIPIGSMIVFYTDGLVETRRNFSAGFAGLKNMISSPNFLNAAHPSEFLVDTAIKTAPFRDDVAVLVIHVVNDQLKVHEWEVKEIIENAGIA